MGVPADQLPIGTIVGEYQITGLLGEGGMGVVYAGIHPVIGKDVAIKVLSPALSRTPDIIARFVQEARAVNQIGHPSIIDIFAFGESPEVGHYFVMPRLEGEDLRQRVERLGPLPIPQALSITGLICDALGAAHDKNILHRDLKPDNVFLVPNRSGGDSVKVLDFGIAKLSENDAITVTRTGAPMGTPLFMSPEQWEAINIDHRTDIYALGILFHYMITGRFPYESTSAVALMRMHCDEAPAPPSAYGTVGWFDHVIARALAKNPNDRYASTADFIAALAEAANQQSSGLAFRPKLIDDEEQVAAKRSNTLTWLIGAAVLAVAAVVIIIIAAKEDPTKVAPQEPPETAATSAETASTPAKATDVATPPTEQATEPPTQPAAIKVSVEIDSQPRGAAIVAADGTNLGFTPKTLSVPRSKKPVVYRLELPGYEARRAEVVPEKDEIITMRLSKVRRGGKGKKPPAGTPTNKENDRSEATVDKSDKTDKTAGDKSGSGNKEKWGDTTKVFD